jgi:hypothetical protein
MTLNKHRLDGIPQIQARTLPSGKFETLLLEAGYTPAGLGNDPGNRSKIWWVHSEHRRIEAIYSPDRSVVITAYHPTDA